MFNPIKIFKAWREKRRIRWIKNAIISMQRVIFAAQINAVITAPIAPGTDRNAEAMKKAVTIADICINQAMAIIEIENTDFSKKAVKKEPGFLDPIIKKACDRIDEISNNLKMAGCRHEFSLASYEGDNAKPHKNETETVCKKCGFTIGETQK